MAYTFKKTKGPTPGTGDLAFLPPTSLPALSFIGPAVMAQFTFGPLQAFPQVFYNLALTQGGINGIPTGSIGQPALQNMDETLAQWAGAGLP